MTGPINTIIGELPHTEESSWVQIFDDAAYCFGEAITRVDLLTGETKVIRNGHSGIYPTLVDLHQPIEPSTDPSGASQPDRRIYFGAENYKIGEIVPALYDRYTSIPSIHLQPKEICCMVGANSGKYLYFFDRWDYSVKILSLTPVAGYAVGSIHLDYVAYDLAISLDDRVLYAAHPDEELMSVIDMSAFPAAVTTVPVANGPCGLAMSADGTRLFVAQSGWVAPGSVTGYGSGSLTVYDTATMQGLWIYIDKGSFDVVVNVAGTRAYVSNVGADTVSVVEVTDMNLEVVDTITGFRYPSWMSLSTDERRLYVASLDLRAVSVVAV